MRSEGLSKPIKMSKNSARSELKGWDFSGNSQRALYILWISTNLGFIIACGWFGFHLLKGIEAALTGETGLTSLYRAILSIILHISAYKIPVLIDNIKVVTGYLMTDFIICAKGLVGIILCMASLDRVFHMLEKVALGR